MNQLCSNCHILIMCPAPILYRQWWGDYHYAKSLQKAFQEAGATCHVRLHNQWNLPVGKATHALHLRGLHPIKPIRSLKNFLWVISHPETLENNEFDGCDAVLGCSYILCDYLKHTYNIAATVMPQATDEHRFHFIEGIPAERCTNQFLFVGNSRSIARPIVMDAIKLKLPIQVYGGEWAKFIPKKYLYGAYIPNERLASCYKSALCVLNDHWQNMATHGMLSNRLFDVIASGGIAISDHVLGISELFRTHVKTYSTLPELSELTRHIHDWAPSEKARRELSKEILAHHSFRQRAKQLLKLFNMS